MRQKTASPSKVKVICTPTDGLITLSSIDAITSLCVELEKARHILQKTLAVHCDYVKEISKLNKD